MLILLLGLLLLLGNRPFALATPLEDLVTAAKKEGVIELLAPSTTGEKGAQALGNAFNKKYGLNIKINYTPSSNMTGDVAKVVMGAASRATPDWDLMLIATLTDSFISQAKKEGAPIVFAEGLDPVISPTYNAGVPKGARHPNVGHLFAVFLTFLEAQEVWEKFNGQTSALIPGTTAYKYAQGKRLLQMTQNQAQTVDRLARQYGKILGFER